jgi:class 3 adenylate cyclase
MQEYFENHQAALTLQRFVRTNFLVDVKEAKDAQHSSHPNNAGGEKNLSREVSGKKLWTNVRQIFRVGTQGRINMAAQRIQMQEDGKRCADVLAVAAEIISSLAKHREATGIPLNARIGIATGSAVAGLSGDLQVCNQYAIFDMRCICNKKCDENMKCICNMQYGTCKMRTSY